jgi:sugar (pentulose or hexulose) kinase
MALFIEGGFRKDEAYRSLLAALYPESRVALTGMKEATAVGAAMLGKIAVEGIDPAELDRYFDIEFNTVDAPRLDGLQEYTEAFLRRIRE